MKRFESTSLLPLRVDSQPAVLTASGLAAEARPAGARTLLSRFARLASGLSRTASVAVLWFVVSPVTLQAADFGDPLDWPHWRGPAYDGTSYEKGLVEDFDLAAGKNVAWQRNDVGGRSTPIVMNGRLYTIIRADPDTAGEGEKVVCLDAVTGKTLWENQFNVWLSDVPDTRVGWSSVVGDPETGNVYALGVCGYFQCLDGETGETMWDYPLHEQFGLLSTYGGRTNYPVICDDTVIISAVVIGWGEMARPAHRFLGLDKLTGTVQWFTSTRLLPYDTTYSSPTVTVLNGQKALVFGSGDGQVWAFQPRTGQPIWNFRFSMRGLNVAPLVVGDTVFMGHSEENIDTTAMGSVVALNAASQGDISNSGQLWREDGVMMGKSSPVLVGDDLYCFDDRAKLHVFNTKTGQAVTRRPVPVGGTSMRASPLFADGRVYAFSTSAWSIMVPDRRRGARVVNKGRLPAGNAVYASPICSHGNIYLLTTSALFCLRDPSKESTATDRPAPPVENPVEDTEPAHVQIVPADLLTRPGASQQFEVRLFNARGQLLGTDAAAFRVDGQAQISEDGTFTADATNEHSAAYVFAKVGDLEGRARVRIIPDLPWKFDFEGMSDLPVTWVGARYRHVVRNVGGDQAMVKVTTIPKGTRSRCWFGHPDLSDYTIQADVRGATKNGNMPDIGLIAQGYTLDLQGASQKVEVRTWVPQPLRMAKSVDFQWQPDRWYTLKLSASNESDRAVLRGKVWLRDEPEPEAWTIVADDAAPNRTGSPGLYGKADFAEITLDNISVVAN